MENSKGKKNSQADQNCNSAEFLHALRSTGMLLPVTDEEISSFKEIYGDLNEELPNRFKNLDFLFQKTSFKINPETLTNSIPLSEEVKLAYAARDGQEKIPEHILNQMKELKSNMKQKKSKNSNK